jgi:hypothetical protein
MPRQVAFGMSEVLKVNEHLQDRIPCPCRRNPLSVLWSVITHVAMLPVVPYMHKAFTE